MKAIQNIAEVLPAIQGLLHRICEKIRVCCFVIRLGAILSSSDEAWIYKMELQEVVDTWELESGRFSCCDYEKFFGNR